MTPDDEGNDDQRDEIPLSWTAASHCDRRFMKLFNRRWMNHKSNLWAMRMQGDYFY